MKIVVFGATGTIGRLVVSEALRRGHVVTAFVHRRSLAPEPNLTIVRGDIHDAQSALSALDGQDAVISTLSSWGTSQKDILTAAMQQILPAMEANAVVRIVTLTGNVALVPGEAARPLTTVARTAFSMVAPKILKDADNHLALLAQSNVAWTSVRSPLILNVGPQTYSLNSQLYLRNMSIHRTAVARSLVDLAETTDYARQAPFISRH